jgi:hypothetical protein
MSRTVAQPPDGASGVVPGTYGNSANIATFTVGGDGRLRAAGNVAVAGAVSSITAIASTGGTVAITATPNPITGAGTLALADTAVTPGAYTSANITVDQQGRLTAVASGVGASAVVLDNAAAITYPTAPQTDGVWYGTNAKANARASNTNTVIGNLSTTTAATTGIINLGYSTTTAANNAIAIGTSSHASQTDSIAIGSTAQAITSGISNIAIGKSGIANADYAIAIGHGATTVSTLTVAIGAFATASPSGSIAIGNGAAVSATAGLNGIAIGRVATASNSTVSNIALGRLSSVTANGAIAIGDTAVVSVANGTGIGQNVTVNDTAYALGFGVNTASVVPGYVGVNLNNATFQVPKYTTLYNTTATAAGTTTLTVTSARDQFFTGATTQTVVLPVTSTLALGFAFNIVNDSTGTVTVQSSGANTVVTLSAGVRAIVTCILTSGTTAASWSVSSTSTSVAPGASYIIGGFASPLTFSGTATYTANPVDMSFRYQKMPINGGVLNFFMIQMTIVAGGITAGGSFTCNVNTSVFGGQWSPMTDVFYEGQSPVMKCTGTPRSGTTGAVAFLASSVVANCSFTSVSNIAHVANYVYANSVDRVEFTPVLFQWMTAS